MHTESCCVCNNRLFDTAGVKKHKRLHGKSCHNSKTILNELLLETFSLPVLAFKETSNPDAMLCYSCNLQMTNLSKYKLKIKEIKENIHQKFSHLNKLQEPSLSTLVMDRRQSLESNPIIRKRLHLPTSTISDQQASSQPLPGEYFQDQNGIDLNDSSLNNETSYHESSRLMCSPQTPCRPTKHSHNQNNFNQPLLNNAASNHESPSLSVSI